MKKVILSTLTVAGAMLLLSGCAHNSNHDINKAHSHLGDAVSKEVNIPRAYNAPASIETHNQVYEIKTILLRNNLSVELINEAMSDDVITISEAQNIEKDYDVQMEAHERKAIVAKIKELNGYGLVPAK